MRIMTEKALLGRIHPDPCLFHISCCYAIVTELLAVMMWS